MSTFELHRYCKLCIVTGPAAHKDENIDHQYTVPHLHLFRVHGVRLTSVRPFRLAYVPGTALGWQVNYISRLPRAPFLKSPIFLRSIQPIGVLCPLACRPGTFKDLPSRVCQFLGFLELFDILSAVK